MGNIAIITAYNKFINLKIEQFLNSFQDKKIQLHLLTFASFLSFMEEGKYGKRGSKNLKKLFIYDVPYFNSANDNKYITHVKVEESNIKLFEFIKKCVQKDIRNRKIEMNVGKKAEEWTEYFKQLIHNAEYKDEYHQAFQEWPTYDSYANGTENNSYNNLPTFHSIGDNNLSNFRYIGNNSLPDREIFKPDYSLLLIVLPFVVFLLFLVCLFNCCMQRFSNRVTSTSDSREETEMNLVQYEEFQDVELHQHGSMINIEL